ncbi:DUF4124 domain-containing protein [Ottowia sp. VDI28]|uniref:DUF4124 domain-containing protein n=1 Tax=Ottowia sp. VDI28 TaxID=3133968 RepID=UPI003C2AC5B1
MNTLRFFIACAALAVCGVASAQYQWVDKDGRKIYSDRPPPADVPQKNILKQPRGASVTARRAAAAASVPGAQEASSAPAAARAASATGTDKTLEEKKKQAEAAEAAKKKEEEQKIAAQRAESCKRAQAAKVGLDSGIRMARMNDRGEREILDDAARAAELERTQAIIQSDCK